MLTNKELLVYSLLIEGYTKSEIAQMKHISIKSVNLYTANIFKKLGVNNRVQLFVKYICVSDNLI